MFHIHCRHCDRSAQYSSESATRSEGWRDTETESVTGPTATEGVGTCPDCAAD